jgi:hypothetical protein
MLVSSSSVGSGNGKLVAISNSSSTSVDRRYSETAVVFRESKSGKDHEQDGTECESASKGQQDPMTSAGNHYMEFQGEGMNAIRLMEASMWQRTAADKKGLTCRS